MDDTAANADKKQMHWVLAAPPLVLLALAVVWFWNSLVAGNLDWIFPVGDAAIPEHNERVIAPGMMITARTPSGAISITAGNGLKRSYTWEGATRSVEMLPRTERWYGSLGLYFPGSRTNWMEHNGVTKAVLEEAQLNFSSTEQALKWLARTPAMVPYIYRNDGLAVWYHRKPRSNVLGVDVVQVYVKANKPQTLTGAHDDLISVQGGGEIPSTTVAPADLALAKTAREESK